MCYTLDRNEGEYSVLISENGETQDVPASELFPQDRKARCGDVFEKTDKGFEYSEELTEKRRERMVRRTRNMFE